MTPVTHYPPRHSRYITRKRHNRQLAWCFISSVAFIVILALVSWAWGQEHPFPFKTLEDITTGTPAWVSDGLPRLEACQGLDVQLLHYQFESGGGSWGVWTDGRMFSAAYFSSDRAPRWVVEGHIVNGQHIIVDISRSFTAGMTPCDPWLKKSAMEG